MKTIGLLGGTSWPSTLDYYATLNRLVAERRGGFHSARILLHSIDYHAIKSCYADAWEKVPALLWEEVRRTVALGPDLLLVCNNTLHQALDELGDDLDLGRVELVHIVDEVGVEARRRGCRRILLLGTQRTMEGGYYAGRLARDHGLQVGIPDAEHRARIQALQTRLSAGEDPELLRAPFRSLLARYQDYDAVVLACTELPLAVGSGETPLPILNPTWLHCRAAVERALA